jgi:predicted DNA binding CopG/RHH family protein
MKKIKLSRKEAEVERGLMRGEYARAGAAEERAVAKAIAERRKDAVLHIRINSGDLERLKRKARSLGVPYQTFVSELLHHYVR